MMEKSNWIMILAALAIVVLMFSGSALAYLEVNHSYQWENESDRCQGNAYLINLDITNHHSESIRITRLGIHMDWQDPIDFYTNGAQSGWLINGAVFNTGIMIGIPEDAYVGNHYFEIQVDYEIDVNGNIMTEYSSTNGNDFYVESSNALSKRDEAINVISNVNSMYFESEEAANRADEANFAFNDAESYYNMNDWDNAISMYDQAINFGNEAIALENDYDPSSGSSGGDDSGGIFGDGGTSIDWNSIDVGIPAGATTLLFLALLIGTIVVMPVVYFLSKD